MVDGQNRVAADSHIGRLTRWFSPQLVVVFSCVVYAGWVLISADFEPLTFAVVGTQFDQHDPAGSEGYDGQFAYYIARDPAGAVPLIDVPAYRYQRILYPLLARVLAFGQTPLIPWTLLLVNILAIGGGTWATGTILDRFGVSRWYALTYGLYGGQMLALRADLNEPFSQGLVQGALLTAVAQRWRWTAALLSLAVLAKESALIFVAGVGLYLLVTRRWRAAVGLVLVGSLPFAGYQLFLYSWLGRFGLGSGGAGASGFSLMPLGGLFAIGAVSLAALLIYLLVLGPLVVLPALVGLVIAGRDLLTKAWHPVTFCLFLSAAVLFFLPNSSWREIAAMLRLSTGLVAMLVLYGGQKHHRRLLNYSLLLLVSNVVLVNGIAR
jgi:hypothetical protein